MAALGTRTEWNFLSNLNLWGGGWTGWFVPFMFVLSVVVFFHELGHFLVARWCGVRVLVFSIGFGPELIGFDDRHGTRWKISAIPLGGYVKFFGDDNAASVPDQEAIGRMTEAERRDSFFHKPVGARAAIVAAGPIANFILAIVIFAALAFFLGKRQVTVPRIDAVAAGQRGAGRRLQARRPDRFGRRQDGRGVHRRAAHRGVQCRAPALIFVIDRGGQRVTVTATPEERAERDRFGNLQRLGVLDISGPIMPARIAGIVPGSAAAAAGFQPDDRVRKIDGKPVNTFLDLREVVAANPERELEFEVERGGRHDRVARRRPACTARRTTSGAVQRIGHARHLRRRTIRPTPLNPVRRARRADERRQRNLVRGRRHDRLYRQVVVVGQASADQLGGPIRIAQVAGQVATSGFIADPAACGACFRSRSAC